MFLFRQHGSLSDPVCPRGNYLQERVSTYSVKHRIISVQPQRPTRCRQPYYTLVSQTWSKTLHQEPNKWTVFLGGCKFKMMNNAFRKNLAIRQSKERCCTVSSKPHKLHLVFPFQAHFSKLSFRPRSFEGE